jgi:hypothetical protein
MVANTERLGGKQVVVKFPGAGRALTATVEDVDEIGVWIKGNALATGQDVADISRSNTKGTAPTFAHPISFVPWSRVEYIVTASEKETSV